MLEIVLLAKVMSNLGLNFREHHLRAKKPATVTCSCNNRAHQDAWNHISFTKIAVCISLSEKRQYFSLMRMQKMLIIIYLKLSLKNKQMFNQFLSFFFIYCAVNTKNFIIRTIFQHTILMYS